METNFSNIEKSEQIVCSSDYHGSGQMKSFTCTFCKRGFSNAQALGGHMNIHRKDRAKLRQLSDESLLSIDIKKKNFSDHSQASADDNPSQPESCTEEKSCTAKRAWIPTKENDATHGDEDGIEERGQLHLFVQTVPSANHDPTIIGQVSGREEKQTDLDLELRLGPEPRESSKTGTRKFF